MSGGGIGVLVTIRGFSCGHENPVHAKFCLECGAALVRQCPQCRAELPSNARFCPECGASAAEQGAQIVARPADTEAATPAGERRQLTVLFCDLVGSTPLSQQLDAEEWRYVVAQYQKAVRAAVGRWGGHVAKEMGDGLLVYFGWPDAREDDPERAIRAGLAILDAMAPVNAKLAAGDGTRLAVRIGMHTGPVVIADGGEIFGETANISARVQGAAEPDTVVVTAATQRLVAGIFVLEDRGPQALKGVRDPVQLYRVVQPSGVRSRLDVAAGHLTRFVGREVELATLVDRWERAADGEGQNVLIVGEAGVGKSRLAYQLRERLATTPHTWLECGTSPYTEGTPFHPVMALVAQGLAFTDADTAAEKVEKIERGLRGLASPENVAVLADFLGLPPPTSFTMNPDVQRRKTMELLAQWNLAISAIQPLVLLVEDLHWSDASSLELLGRIIAQSATARVLFIATARPEFTPPWPARSNSTTLSLARLTKRQARDMVTTLLGETLPADTVEALVARADGVPLYVEELTKAVAEPGAARGADAIPSTLAGSLMARLDRLSAAKEVAQRAAVLGREFGYPLLAAIAGMEDAGLRQGLTRLVDAEIVFQRGEPPDATYTFKHALVQEAAYESLLKCTRQQLHGRVVDVLRERFPERVESEPSWWRATPRRRGGATTRSRTTAERVSGRRRARRTKRRSGSSGRRWSSWRRGPRVRSAASASSASGSRSEARPSPRAGTRTQRPGWPTNGPQRWQRPRMTRCSSAWRARGSRSVTTRAARSSAGGRWPPRCWPRPRRGATGGRRSSGTPTSRRPSTGRGSSRRRSCTASGRSHSTTPSSITGTSVCSPEMGASHRSTLPRGTSGSSASPTRRSRAPARR